MSQHGSFLTDRFPPILVRQLRRLVRSHVFTATTLLYFLFSVPAMILCLLLVGVRPHAVDMAVFWSAAAVGVTQYLIVFAEFAPVSMFISAKTKDELFDQSFSSREILFGYVSVGAYLAFYYVCLSLPYSTLAYVFGGDPFTAFFTPIYSGLVCLMLSLYYFSFLAKLRGNLALIVGIVIMMFGGSLPLAGHNLFEMIIQIINSMRVLSPTPVGGTSPWLALSVLEANDFRLVGYSILFYAVIVIAAYKLSLSHLNHPRRSIGIDLLLNLLVYGGISTVATLLWMALRYGGVI